MDIRGVVLVAWTQAWISMLAWILIMDNVHAIIDLKIHAGHGYRCSFGSMYLSMGIHTCMDLRFIHSTDIHGESHVGLVLALISVVAQILRSSYDMDIHGEISRGFDIV